MINFIIETILYYPIWATSILIPSIIAFWFGSTRLWVFFNMVFTFTSKIVKLKPGKVEIKGKVKAIDTIPGLKRKAVYYKKVDEVLVIGKNRSWKTKPPEKIEETFLSFKVVDDTGEVIVIPDIVERFDIEKEIVQLDNSNRIVYHFLEEDDDVYVLGNFDKIDDDNVITQKGKAPFIISNLKEKTLIKQYAIVGFSFTLFVVLVISIALFFAAKEWNKSWEGLLENKYISNSGSTKSKKLHYIFILEGKLKIEVSEEEYRRAKINDYLIKHKKRYDLEIKAQKSK